MPLDPQVAQLVQWAQRSRMPPYPRLGVAAAREHYAKASATLDIVPPRVHSTSDHVVALQGRSLRVREYAPWSHSWSEPRPVLLFFHGGGFTIGSIETHDRACRMLAVGGDCLVYSVDYRLAPEHRFPSAHDDAFDVLAWLRSEHEALGVDPLRIAVGGDSAGGTLAAACAIHARDQGWPLALQLLIYPGLASFQDSESHKRLANGYLLDADLIQWFFEGALRDASDRRDWRFAPLAAADLRGVAPAWIAGAEYDPLVDENRAYAQRLRDAGVPVRFEQYDGMIHGFLHHAGFVQAAQRLHVDACAALREGFAVDAPRVDAPRAVELRTGNWAELGSDALAVRTAVFVREQGIPADLEHDDRDAQAVHCVAYRGGRPVGTGRLLPEGRIGRMAVLCVERRNGLGRRILGELVACAVARGHSQIELSAQRYVESFYASLGFDSIGEPYYEAGIPHVRMRRRLAPG